MKEERLLSVLSDIDETFIEEAQPKRKKKSALVFGLATAACLCVVIFLSIYAIGEAKIGKEKNIVAINKLYSTEPIDELAHQETVKLSGGGFYTNLFEFSQGDTGMSAVMFYNDKELMEYVDADNNTLLMKKEPFSVYECINYSDELQMNLYLNEEGVKNVARAIAENLNQQDIKVAGEYDFGIDGTERVCYMAKAFTEDYKIYVDADYEISIVFNEPLELDSYSFYDDERTSDEEAKETLEYLTKKYSSLYDFEVSRLSYEMSYYKSDYFNDGTRIEGNKREYCVYDENSFDENFKNKIEFIPNEYGKLSRIEMSFPLAGYKALGEYSIISESQAREKLLDSVYISNVPNEYLKDGKIYEGKISAVSLEYLCYRYVLPYYCYYVELDCQLNVAEGLKHYGIFYVPAWADKEADLKANSIRFN